MDSTVYATFLPHIVLEPPATDPGITDEERRTILEMMAKGSCAGITLATA
ncbi:MAG: hypothetical protein HY681_09430 [Chloroflexi bacterium]|nr:hypothetical protein [Chloroflexota bacterium]